MGMPLWVSRYQSGDASAKIVGKERKVRNDILPKQGGIVVVRGEDEQGQQDDEGRRR